MVERTGRVLRRVLSDDETAKALLAEAMEIEADDFVSKIRDFIIETEKANENKPLAHFTAEPPRGKPFEPGLSDKYRKPGIRMASKVKRYPRFCEL